MNTQAILDEQIERIIVLMESEGLSVAEGNYERYKFHLEQILTAPPKESNPDRTFSGEFEPETKLAELTQFNSEGEKIAHFVYTIP